uniref:lycopene beta-cyclase n=1 Tax=Campylaephora kondoi TaxID=218449 RepID=A0A290WNI8_9FLOR|nr:lycopene beta-cyclase [Campylaephora kondoi]
MAFVNPTVPPAAAPLSHRASSTLCPGTAPLQQHRRRTPPVAPALPARPYPATRMVATSPSRLPQNSPAQTQLYDVIVVGGGPAGLSLASSLGARGLTTLCADLTLDKPWPNNYGTWVDELDPLGLADCTSHQWRRVAAYVRADGGKSALGRDYARVDRHAMKERFLQRCRQTGNVTIIQAAANSVDTASDSFSTVVLGKLADAPDETREVRGKVVVDCTGHNLRFVRFNEGKTPGFQAAYGIECTIGDSTGPFDSDEMVLMDFRDDHMQEHAADRALSEKEPTFIYVMPLDNGEARRFFFEETSLVASPAMPFDALKERLYKRLDYYGIDVQDVQDEEFCLIPMGGEMPDLRQRVVAFGGSAALVHPATGYMIARALKLADQAAEIISQEVQCGGGADETAHRIWDRIWNTGRRHQRDFFNFGGEYLAKIDLSTTREFFGAFFQLPKDEWSGFLSFRLVKPLERLKFGLGVFARTTNRVRASISFDALVRGGFPLFMSILPLYKVEDE